MTAFPPFAEPSALDHELPDFAAVRTGELIPALRTALDDHDAEIAAIVANPEEPTWENTMEALEASGRMLSRVLAVIGNYSGTMADAEMTAVEEEATPLLAAHHSTVLLNRDLYARVRAMPPQPEGSEEEALLRHHLRRFERGGAALDEAGRAELTRIDARLADLSTSFGLTLLEATEEAAVHVTDPARLAGLSAARREQLAADAREAGKEGWLIRLGLPSVQPILEEVDDAALRADIARASRDRTAGRNDATVLEIARLRARRAELLGYASHAAFVAEEETAGSLAAVDGLLDRLTPAAVANAQGEYKRVLDLAAVSGGADAAADTDGDGGADTPVVGEADWPYWAARLRAEDLAVDEDALRAYFPLDRVLRDGAFHAAHRLYGIRVEPRPDLVGYHPDVDVWEVTEEDGTPVGLLLTDMFARPGKRGGAWMSGFVEQNRLLGQTPVVVNVLNIARPADGAQALLSLDEVFTVFHEFGHALHGLLSDVRYPSLSGTNVPRDFVEFPSQINENWACEPEVLGNYARHVDTGEPLPPEMVAAVREASRWGQGFATTEYLAACRVDLAWHRLTVAEAEAVTDVAEFERRALEDAGLAVPGIAPRYRSAYFNHIFAGGYSADYWSYMWAEVLDADGFRAFVDTDAAVDPDAGEATPVDPSDVRFAGERFRRMILSRGATIDYEDAFWMFRGRQTSVEPLLARRGLAGTPPTAG
ncbi:M3 family metallopeptidase [Corynebacterium bovis]|uniref:M3 family metallopeptidase n=1 Tax=Corynebacterium bovis TaxID=36808 RepID=UPI003139A981